MAAATGQLPTPLPACAAELYSEDAVADIYQRSVPAIATIFDANLPRAGGGPTVGAAEGNGSGFMWDERHLVTCYHVLSRELGAASC